MSYFLYFLLILHPNLVFMQYLVLDDNEKNDVDGRYGGLCRCSCQ